MSSLLTLLHRFPDLAILAVVVGTLVGLAILAPHLGSSLLRLQRDDARSSAALDAFKAVVSMTAVVLAFALVQATTNLKHAESIVAKEAAAISAADRTLLRSGNPQLAALRPELDAYGRAIIEREWPKLANGERDDNTDALYGALSVQARATTPADARQEVMFAELLRLLDDIADLREQRIADADAELPGFFWDVMTAMMVLGFGLALLTTPKLGQTVTLGAGAAAVSLLLAFVLIVDQPFSGETSVTAKEISKALWLDARRS